MESEADRGAIASAPPQNFQMADVSLIVCTRNRAAQLRRCLDHLAAVKTARHWQLIVVDNGSTDNTSEVTATFARSTPIPTTLLHQPIPGLGRARNTGIAAARGALVAFTDDDCYVAADYIDRICEVFEDPKIGYCGGRIKLFDPGDYPITIKDSEIAQPIPPHTRLEAGMVHGANMIFRKQALSAIGGFDDAFGAGAKFSCEDVDACARANLTGWWGLYAPGPLVFHHHGRKAKDVPSLRRNYALARGAFNAKFVLRQDSRKLYLTAWRWRLMKGLRRSPEERRECLWEIGGALRYLSYRLYRVLRIS